VLGVQCCRISISVEGRLKELLEGIPFRSVSIGEVASKLAVDLERGLDADEVERRRAQFGPNALTERPRPSFWERLWNQLNQFLVLILIFSAVVSMFLGWTEYQKTGAITEFIDAGAIVAIVVLNAALGMIQEGKAEEGLAALKKMAAPNALTLRGGRLENVPARDLVPGDVVVLEMGNLVPADVRLIESFNLRIDEASLTGESVPVEKDAQAILPEDAALGDRRNCGYMGTMVSYGRGRGVVAATGMATEFGKIATMIQEAEEDPTPLQIKLDQLGKWLGIASLIVCGVVGLLGIVRDPTWSVLWQDGVGAYLVAARETLMEMFMVSVSLAIAAVPEGLPAVVTVCLALGMQEMVRRNALIRRLPAVETLGSTTVICSDKTGTLTQNKMMVTRVYVDDSILTVSGSGYEPMGEFSRNGKGVGEAENPGLDMLARAVLLCSDAELQRDADESGIERNGWRIVGDPTEGALVVLAAKNGLWRKEAEAEYPRVDEVPFESSRKRMSTIHQAGDGEYVVYVKGAADWIVDLCDRVYLNGEVKEITREHRRKILETNRLMASDALRVLGVAYRPLSERQEHATAEEIEQQLVFVGLAGMIDPARPEVRGAIEVAVGAGIKTVMVTGDYRETAIAIGGELGLLDVDKSIHEQVMTGTEMDRLDDESFENIVEDIRIYARVSPANKVRIVDTLKKRGHIAAMTGDGVNDAPALKRANIGVAMGIAGTDVSKETADMVLADDNYASIVSAVEEGRIIYSNIRKFVYYLLSCNVAEIVILFVAMMFDLGLPLTVLQLLILNLVTDGAPALALGLEKGEPNTMEHPPRPANEPIINGLMIRGTIVQTIAIAGSVLVAFLIGRSWYGSTGIGLQRAQTMAFVTLSASELLRAYTSRSEHYPISRIGVFTNKYMQWAVAVSSVVLLATLYLPFLSTEIFGNQPLGLREWTVVLPLLFVPALVAEINKWVGLRLEKRRRALKPAA